MLKPGDFVMEHGRNGERFMIRVKLEWQDENPRPDDERDWNNPWHRAQMIEERHATLDLPRVKEFEKWARNMKKVTHEVPYTSH